MPSYITISRQEHQALLAEVRRGMEVCGEVSLLRVVLQGLMNTRLGPIPVKEIAHAIESCEEVSRLRVELSAFERRLREFDQELTPVKPPSRTDIQAAFENSIDFASGKKKPPGG